MLDLAANHLHFAGFVLDSGRRALTRDGAAVELRPRSFDVLAYLAAAAGRVVGKEELLAALWPGVVVTDESLTRCVSDIRQALADHDQQIIKTLPRRGYICVAPVARAEADTAPGAHAAVAPPAVPVAPKAPPGQLAGAAAGLPPARWLAALGLGGLLVAAAAAWTLMRTPPQRPPPPLSIAVLPLESRHGDPAQDALAELLTDEITVDLSRIPDSFVIARASADRYRGAEARRAGGELGVRYVLQGSLVRTGQQLRLSLQLVYADNGGTRWADRIDGDVADLGALYGRVTGTVARTLDLEIGQAEVSRLLTSSAVAAQDPVLLAWSLLRSHRPDTVAQARELLLKVTARDGASPLAWALLAETYNTDVGSRWFVRRGATRDEWLAQALAHSERAYAMDPDHTLVVGARGTALALARRGAEALPLFERQIALNRNDATGWWWRGYAHATLGQQEQAITALQQAIRLSPRDPRVAGFYVVAAAAYLYMGRDHEALEWARKSAAEHPSFGIAHSWVAAAAGNLGDTEVARTAAAEFRRLLPSYTIRSLRDEGLCANDLCRAQRERYYTGLAKAGVPE